MCVFRPEDERRAGEQINLGDFLDDHRQALMAFAEVDRLRIEIKALRRMSVDHGLVSAARAAHRARYSTAPGPSAGEPAPSPRRPLSQSASCYHGQNGAHAPNDNDLRPAAGRRRHHPQRPQQNLHAARGGDGHVRDSAHGRNAFYHWSKSNASKRKFINETMMAHADRQEQVGSGRRLRVIRTSRPKYGCRKCENAPVQALSPPRLIAGGLPTEQLVSHVIVSKFADALPLYRQQQIYAREGVDLDRSTLADWVGRAAFELRPVHERLIETIKRSDPIFCDETHVPVLDPGRGKTKTGQFWAIARDGRPYCSDDPPAVAYVYQPGRCKESAAEVLNGYAGTAQVDGYGVYKSVAEEGDVKLSFCMAHVRRKFNHEIKFGYGPIAEEALQWIAELYRIETQARGRPPDERRKIRQEKAKPILDAFRPWLETKLDLISGRSELAKHIRYALNHWNGLLLYLDDGRLEIDSNTVERSMRPIGLTRKNALFAGHDDGARCWARLASLAQTCKLNGVNPQAYFTDVLTKVVNGWPQSRIDDLLPFSYVENKT
ncbi:hypothetical protein CW354_16155 [Marinicaulis flavus]|uniref:Uncharacterized protein n=1 Tax=Hyphococcus luteus TaxID=2058213 RepID=A0A2S7K295_9PROT|nr:hypothetical protein CW354_16155 [Marinicaulis flavus]